MNTDNVRTLRSRSLTGAARLLLAAFMIAATASAQSTTTPHPDESSPRDLPFDRPDGTTPSEQAPAKTARELFQLYGIGDQDFRAFDDRAGLSEAERSVVYRILFRLGRLQTFELAGWSRGPLDLEKAAQAPAAARGEIYHLTGRATGIEVRELPANLRDDFEFDSYYVVTIRSDAESRPVEVLARAVPSAWLSAKQLDAPVGAEAMFLEMHPSDAASAALLATSRVAWFPVQPDPELSVTPGGALLGALGTDIGLFDQTRATNGRPLTAEDRELFYQILAAARRRNFCEVDPQIRSPFDLSQILLDPAGQQSRLVDFRALARRITRVAVDDEDIRRRFQIDHYFELDIMIPLEDQPVRLQGKDPQHSPIYENAYPATFCVTSLPPALERLAVTGDTETDRNALLHETIRVCGVFFKIWAYQSDYVRSFDPEQRHPSPLFLGSTALPVAVPEGPRDDYLAIGLAVLFVVGLGAVWITMLRGARRRAREARARREAQQPARLDLSGRDIPSDPPMG